MSVAGLIRLRPSSLGVLSSIGILVSGVILLLFDGHPLSVLCGSQVFLVTMVSTRQATTTGPPAGVTVTHPSPVSGQRCRPLLGFLRPWRWPRPSADPAALAA